MYIFESTVFLLPITAHFVPVITAAYELGIIDVEKTISMTNANRRFISSLCSIRRCRRFS